MQRLCTGQSCLQAKLCGHRAGRFGNRLQQAAYQSVLLDAGTIEYLHNTSPVADLALSQLQHTPLALHMRSDCACIPFAHVWASLLAW